MHNFQNPRGAPWSVEYLSPPQSAGSEHSDLTVPSFNLPALEHHPVSLPRHSVFLLVAERLLPSLGLLQAPFLSSGSSSLDQPGQEQPQVSTGRTVGGGELGRALVLKLNFMARTTCHAV